MATLKVASMSCNHCVGRIHEVLEGASIKHTIHLETKTVTIEEEEKIEKAMEELDDIGFESVLQ